MRVLTLNLWCRHGAWAERRAALRAGLQELRPDLVAFQETVVQDGYDQVADLLGPGYTIAHQPGRGPDGSGASLASRWPMGEPRSMGLYVTPRVDPAPGWIGSVCAVEIQAPEPIGPLLLVHHKPSWQWQLEHERELQARAAAQFVEDLLGERSLHVLLAGDFDATPDAASIRFWSGRQSLGGMSVAYQDAWAALHPDDPGHTFTRRNPLVAGGEMPFDPGRRIDYLFVRCGSHGPTLEVTRCERAFDGPRDGVWASDHFGVVADFRAPHVEAPAAPASPA